MSALDAIRVESIPQTPVTGLRHACSQCNLRELCLPMDLRPEEIDHIDQIVAERRKVRKGEALFRAGEAFHSLFAIRTGFFKTTLMTQDGREQVTGFQMSGEVMGLDGIVDHRHSCDAWALEDAEVCPMPFGQLEEISRQVPGLQHHLHRLLSREIVREHQVMLMLGSMRAEERVAAFLLNLLQRLQRRGYSGSELVLRMTREEIGSYLGLKLETVSRALSRFADEQWLEVKQRQIRVLNPAILQQMVDACGGSGTGLSTV